VTFDDDAGWLRFRRGTVEVLLNFSAGPVRLAVAGRDLLLSTDDASQPQGGALELAPWSAAIMKDQAKWQDGAYDLFSRGQPL